MLATCAPPLELQADARPGAVGHLRRQVRRWLLDLVDDPDTADDLVLAVSEALENVVDHAFVAAARPGRITVSARHDGARITIVVADDGRWQHDAGDGAQYRGRGLGMIDQLTASCHVSTGPTGTTVTMIHPCAPRM